jgi:hypothetical protein
MMVRHRIMDWMRRLVGRGAPVSTLTPLVLPAWAAWVDEIPALPRVPRPRLLAAQLASQGRLNGPTARRILATRSIAPKRSPVARSVHLQARHLVKAKPVRLTLVPTAPRIVVSRPFRAAA